MMEVMVDGMEYSKVLYMYRFVIFFGVWMDCLRVHFTRRGKEEEETVYYDDNNDEV